MTHLADDVTARASGLGVLAANVDAAIAAYSAAFAEAVTGRTAAGEGPPSADDRLETCRATLHNAIKEFSELRPQAGTDTAEVLQGAPAMLLRAVDAAAAAFAQARLSRSLGWPTATVERLKLRRRELYTAILDYCRSQAQRAGRTAQDSRA